MSRDKSNAKRRPAWRPPAHYGYAAAIDGMGGVAAPFLAGIAIALAVLVISSPEHFGAENVALCALVLAAVGLVGCAECTFVARKYAVTPSQLEEWWPDPDPDQLADEQHKAAATFTRWAACARAFYDIGIVALTVGVAAALVPHVGLNSAPPWRLASFALAIAAVFAEIMAVLIAVNHDRDIARELKRLEERQARNGPAA
jgi:hypothetical protein